MTNVSEWQAMHPLDLDAVNAIADQIHVGLPERPEVFAEKLRLFPAGCRTLVGQSTVVGYGIAHPWMLNSIPPLDEFLAALPANPECLYIHDVVVLPEVRGAAAASRYVAYIKQVALQIRVPCLALVSVYGTDVLWSRFGFRIVSREDLVSKLASYGHTAKYMICDLYE